MAKQTELIEIIESFDLIVNVDNNTITSYELVKYLTNLDALMKSVNHTLNRQYGIGYDQLQLDIIALEKGSFRISTRLKKFLENQYTVGASMVILGGIVTKLISGDSTTIQYNINNSNVEITHEILVSNKESVRAISNIAKTTVESKEIKSLTLEYELSSTQREKIDIEKPTLEKLIVTDIEDIEKESSLLPLARLVIVSPVLEAEQAMWKFRLGERRLSAKMTDDDFLELMDKNKIAFGINDVIVADIETIIIMKSNNTPDVKHYIRKVYQYPQYANKSDQTDTDLFSTDNL